MSLLQWQFKKFLFTYDVQKVSELKKKKRDGIQKIIYR